MAQFNLIEIPGFEMMCRIVVGGIFLVYGLAKLRRLNAFVEGAVEWEVLPAAVVRPLARALPLVEVVLGAALLFGVAVRAAAVAAMIVLCVFAVAVIVNLIHGRRTPCFCAGVASHERVGVATLIRIIVLAVLAVFVAARPVSAADTFPYGGDTVLAILGAALITGLLAVFPALEIALHESEPVVRRHALRRESHRRTPDPSRGFP